MLQDEFFFTRKIQCAYKRLKAGVPVKGVVTLLKFLRTTLPPQNRLTEILRPSGRYGGPRVFEEYHATMYVIAGQYPPLQIMRALRKYPPPTRPTVMCS
ncbi:MAG: hypothetical protein ACLR56_07975 [Oscillospiraceae bacterium]